MRFYQEDAEFVIGDPTEMERYKAPKTPYVGTLSAGKTAGYWLMVLSTLFRGHSLPRSVVGVWFGEAIRDVVYGSADIAQLPEALCNICRTLYCDY